MFLLIFFSLLLFLSLQTALLINWWSSALLVLFWSQSLLQFAIRHLKDKIKFFERALVDHFTGPAQSVMINQITSGQFKSMSCFDSKSAHRFNFILIWFFSKLSRVLKGLTFVRLSSTRLSMEPTVCPLSKFVHLHPPSETKKQPIVTS